MERGVGFATHHKQEFFNSARTRTLMGVCLGQGVNHDNLAREDE
jgi:hypothetical protein